MDSDREIFFAWNENIFKESKLDMHESLGRKLSFRTSRKWFRFLFLSDKS
jgi:hypothetical protein